MVPASDVFALSEMYRAVASLVGRESGTDRHGLTGAITTAEHHGPFVLSVRGACLDPQGKILGRPVPDLLGGAVRDRCRSAPTCSTSGPRTRRGAGLLGPGARPGRDRGPGPADGRGYGFTSIKLKGGVFAPELEVEAIRALRAEFPAHPLRIDPNAVWTVPTSLRVAAELDGVLEYLEDPTDGHPRHGRGGRATAVPLATNMS